MFFGMLCFFSMNSTSSEREDVLRSVKNTGNVALHGISARFEKNGEAYLLLPDDSKIITIFPTAVCLGVVDKTPCTPECEPLIYSVARVARDGAEIWAKSYIAMVPEKIAVCDELRLGFEINTSMFEFVISTNSYFFPSTKTFTVSVPLNAMPVSAEQQHIFDQLMFDINTGNATSQLPQNVKVIDAGWLHSVKQNIWKNISIEFPDVPKNRNEASIENRRAQTVLNEKRKHIEFFKRTQTAVFRQHK